MHNYKILKNFIFNFKWQRTTFRKWKRTNLMFKYQILTFAISFVSIIRVPAFISPRPQNVTHDGRYCKYSSLIILSRWTHHIIFLLKGEKIYENEKGITMIFLWNRAVWQHITKQQITARIPQWDCLEKQMRRHDLPILTILPFISIHQLLFYRPIFQHLNNQQSFTTPPAISCSAHTLYVSAIESPAQLAYIVYHLKSKIITAYLKVSASRPRHTPKFS